MSVELQANLSQGRPWKRCVRRMSRRIFWKPAVVVGSASVISSRPPGRSSSAALSQWVTSVGSPACCIASILNTASTCRARPASVRVASIASGRDGSSASGRSLPASVSEARRRAVASRAAALASKLQQRAVGLARSTASAKWPSPAISITSCQPTAPAGVNSFSYTRGVAALGVRSAAGVGAGSARLPGICFVIGPRSGRGGRATPQGGKMAQNLDCVTLISQDDPMEGLRQVAEDRRG